MQIVETSNEGLRRGFSLTIPAAEIAAKVAGEVARLAPQVRMPGFRPGKVPANLIRKMHGAQLHQEALNTAIREGVDQLIAQKALRPAAQPQLTLGEGYTEGADAELAVALEVLPAIAVPNLDGLKLEKMVVPADEAEVDAALARLATSAKRFEDAPAGHRAAAGDQLVIDFIGSIDGAPFDGGKGEDATIEIGAGRFIPGFEEPLIGAAAGEEKTLAVTFPADYPVATLKGKAAEFAVTVKAVKVPRETPIDDAFAKSLGLADLATLRQVMQGQVEQETASLTRTQMKRQLLDTLAAAHDFEVPPSMVEAEFAQIWQQLEAEAAREPDPAAARAEMEAEREEYRAIAVRRVRLGLLLSEIGQANGITVTEAEMQQLIGQEAQRYRPEDRQKFVDYIRADAMAAAQLRAPLYEEKVVDFLFGKAEVTEREVTREELEAAIAAEDTASQETETKPAEKPAAKKRAKAAAESEGVATEAKPAKKAAAKKAEAENAAGDEAKPAKKPATKKPAAKTK